MPPADPATKRRNGFIGCGVIIAALVACTWWGSTLPDPPPEPTATPAPTVTPTAPATAVPSDTPKQTATRAVNHSLTEDEARAAFEALKVTLGEFNKGAGGGVFTSAKIGVRAGSPRCTVAISDMWYALQEFEKERLLSAMSGYCAAALITAVPRFTKTETDGYLTTSLEDVAGEEVAFASPLRSKIVR